MNDFGFRNLLGGGVEWTVELMLAALSMVAESLRSFATVSSDNSLYLKSGKGWSMWDPGSTR